MSRSGSPVTGSTWSCTATATSMAVTRQVARVVSADHDGEEFERVCAGDPVLARVHAVAPGFRPANFHSPYDACVWSVLSARRQRRQAIALRQRLSERHGRTFELAGQTLAALPTPRTLGSSATSRGCRTRPLPGCTAIAEAAAAGRLDIDRLTATDARGRDGSTCSSCRGSARSTAPWW